MINYVLSYTLTGPSGCGKTTLLSSILGMISLDHGSATVLGEKVSSSLKVGPQIGYMPQETALVDQLTIKETVYFFGKILLMNSKDLKQRYEMIRRILELPSDDLMVEKCSGGELRRVSLAVAIIHSPKLLILGMK